MNGTGFMPHGYCFQWQVPLLVLHVISDALIALAYFSIPLTLWLFVRKRTDIPFSQLFVLFGIFIGACGFTHVMGIVTIWHPWYWLDGTLKLVTAAASIATAIVMLPVVPRALALRSPGELEALNAELERLLEQKSDLLAAYERERYVADTLQQALLPQEFPHIDGLTISTAYLGAEGMAIGGDWFDAFALSDRLLAFSCGDVAGHGLHAATAMGSVRQMVRTAAREDEDPAVVLGRVNRSVCHDGRDLVTVFYGVLDLDSGALRYASAGHPAPILVTPGEPTQSLEAAGVILGVDASTVFERRRATLKPGSLLAAYTDGFVEFSRDIDAGHRLLTQAVEASATRSNAAEAIRDRMFATAAPRDDAALLCLTVHTLGADPFRLHRRAWRVDASDGERGVHLRTAIMQYLAEYGSPQSDFSNAELIVGELIGNVARHTTGHAGLEITWRDGSAVLTVDSGGDPYDIPPAAENLWKESGRGLRIIASIAPDVRVERNDAGNRLTATLPVWLA